MDIEVCGEAVNGQEAIEKAKELRLDLILLDVTMPVPKIVHPPSKAIRRAGFPTIIAEQSLKQKTARNSSGLSFACFLADAVDAHAPRQIYSTRAKSAVKAYSRLDVFWKFTSGAVKPWRFKPGI